MWTLLSDKLFTPFLILFPKQPSLSYKESIRIGLSASERFLAAFLSKLENRRKDCLTSCYQTLRKLGYLDNYRFPTEFRNALFKDVFNQLNKSLMKIALHSNTSSQKCRKSWLCISSLDSSTLLWRLCCPLLMYWYYHCPCPLCPESCDSITSP